MAMTRGTSKLTPKMMRRARRKLK
jgi:hypothetical protein